MKANNYSNMTAIAVNKSLLKEYQTSYGRTVYLNKDSEFQIKLFNPTTETIGADIIINGKSLGEKLVIRPGQLIWLERYFNEARKFRFDVYEVDAKAEAVREAIRNNGDIQVRFYKERPKQNIWISNTFGYNGKYSSPATFNPGVLYSAGDVCTNQVDTITTSNLTFGLNDNVKLCSATCDSFNSTRGVDKGTKKLFKSTPSNEETMETGRVERGGYSDQRFMEVDIDFEAFSFKSEEIKLLPKSQKPVFKEDLQKLYCTECGRKVKPKFKYCPFCGGKL